MFKKLREVAGTDRGQSASNVQSKRTSADSTVPRGSQLSVNELGIDPGSPSNLRSYEERTSTLAADDSDSASVISSIIYPSGTEGIELHTRFQRVLRLARGYKEKLKQAVSATKRLERERDQLLEVLEDSQAKASRRIDELCEQCELNRRAKEDVETNYRLLLNEKDEFIQVLRLQVSLLRDGKNIPDEVETKINTGLKQEAKRYHSLDLENQELKAKISQQASEVSRMRHELTDSRLSQSALETQVAQLKERLSVMTSDYDVACKTLPCDVTTHGGSGASMESLQLELASVHERLRISELNRCRLQSELDYLKSHQSAAQTTTDPPTVIDDTDVIGLNFDKTSSESEEIFHHQVPVSVLTDKDELTAKPNKFLAHSVGLDSESFYSAEPKQPFDAVPSQLNMIQLELSHPTKTDIIEKENSLRSVMTHHIADLSKLLDANLFSLDAETLATCTFEELLAEWTKFIGLICRHVADKNDQLLRLSSSLETVKQESTDHLNSVICEHKSQMSNLQVALTTAVDSNNELKRQLDVSANEISELRRDYEDNRLQLSEANRLLEATRDLLSRCTTDRDQLVEKCAQCESAYMLLEEERNTLFTQLCSATVVETECKELRAKVSELTQTMEEKDSKLSTEVSILTTQLSDSNARLNKSQSLLKHYHDHLFDQLGEIRQQLVPLGSSLVELKSQLQSGLNETSDWMLTFLQRLTTHLTANLLSETDSCIPAKSVLETLTHLGTHGDNRPNFQLSANRNFSVTGVNHAVPYSFSAPFDSSICQEFDENYRSVSSCTDGALISLRLDDRPTGSIRNNLRRPSNLLNVECQTVSALTDEESLCVRLQQEVSQWDELTQMTIKMLCNEQEARLSNISAALQTSFERLGIIEQQLTSRHSNPHLVHELQSQVNNLQASLAYSENLNVELNRKLSDLVTQISKLTDENTRSQHDASTFSKRLSQSLLFSLQSMTNCANNLVSSIAPHLRGLLTDELLLMQEDVSRFSSTISTDSPNYMNLLDQFENLEHVLMSFVAKSCANITQSYDTLAAEAERATLALSEMKKQYTSLQKENEEMECELLRARANTATVTLQSATPAPQHLGATTYELAPCQAEPPPHDQVSLGSCSKAELEYADRVISLELQLQEFKELCESKDTKLEINEDMIKRLKAESSDLNKLYTDTQQRLNELQRLHTELQCELSKSQEDRVVMEERFATQLTDTKSAASSRERQLRQQLKDTKSRLKQVLHDSECMRRSISATIKQSKGTETEVGTICDECERLQGIIEDLRHKLERVTADHVTPCVESGLHANQSKTYAVNEPTEDEQIVTESIEAEHSLHIQKMQGDFERQLHSKELELRTYFEKELDIVRCNEARKHQATMEDVQRQLDLLHSENESLRLHADRLQSELTTLSAARAEEPTVSQMEVVSELRSKLSALQARFEQVTRSPKHPSETESFSGTSAARSEDPVGNNNTHQATQRAIQSSAFLSDSTDGAPPTELVRQLRDEIMHADSIDSLHPSVRSTHYSSQIFMKDYEALQLHNADLQNQLHQLAADFEALRSRCPTCNGSHDPDSGARSYITGMHSPSNSSMGISLHEMVEYEYLKNVLFEYMMGRETSTLSKVLCSIMQFNPEQTKRILQHENIKSRTWTLQSRIE